MSLSVRIGHLYPDYLNIYADRGNMGVFARRAAARGLELEVVPALEAALDRGLELTDEGAELVVLPTYTAMLALRRIVAERGHVPQYWERAA